MNRFGDKNVARKAVSSRRPSDDVKAWREEKKRNSTMGGSLSLTNGQVSAAAAAFCLRNQPPSSLFVSAAISRAFIPLYGLDSMSMRT